MLFDLFQADLLCLPAILQCHSVVFSSLLSSPSFASLPLPAPCTQSVSSPDPTTQPTTQPARLSHNPQVSTKDIMLPLACRKAVRSHLMYFWPKREIWLIKTTSLHKGHVLMQKVSKCRRMHYSGLRERKVGLSWLNSTEREERVEEATLAELEGWLSTS